MNKLVFSLLLSLFFCLPMHAAVQWLGGSGDWEDAAQWDTGQVPGPSDDVILTNGKIVLNSSVTVRSLDVNPSVTFTVGNYARLNILPISSTYACMMVSGKMVVYGVVQILDQLSAPSSMNFFVYGRLQTENGSEVILEGCKVSIFNNGIYNNRGFLHVEGFVGTAFDVHEGILLNSRTLEVVGDETGNGIRIHPLGQLINHRDIYLEDLQTGIRNENRIYNSRNIFITNCSTGIINFDLLDNWYGLLKLEQMNFSHSILNTEDGNIRNRGRIEVANSTGANGLRNHGSVTNYSSGRIYLRGAHGYELLKNDDDGNFNNYGRINIYPTASNLQGGLRNSGDFTNHSSGYIAITGNYTKAFNNLVNFTNQGFLSVSNAQHLSVYNEGVLTNSACGEMIVYKRFENTSSGVWLNDSWLRLTSSYTPINNGFFQNTAVIEDRANVLSGVNINNDGVIAHSLTSLVYVGINSNILDIGSLTQVGLPNYFYDEPGGNQVGTYNSANNTLDVYPSAEGLKEFYFEAELLGYNCTDWFAMELPDAVQPNPNPFAGIPGGFSVSNVVDRTSVYPNPSNGLVTIDWSREVQLETVRWSVVNLQGQEVATGTSAQDKIDLTSFPAATYLLRQQNEAGAWEITERIIVQ